jgi:hypothetical protein
VENKQPMLEVVQIGQGKRLKADKESGNYRPTYVMPQFCHLDGQPQECTADTSVRAAL